MKVVNLSLVVFAVWFYVVVSGEGPCEKYLFYKSTFCLSHLYADTRH